MHKEAKMAPSHSSGNYSNKIYYYFNLDYLVNSQSKISQCEEDDSIDDIQDCTTYVTL